MIGLTCLIVNTANAAYTTLARLLKHGPLALVIVRSACANKMQFYRSDQLVVLCGPGAPQT